MREIRVVSKINETDYHVRLVEDAERVPGLREHSFSVAHDYVQFGGMESFADIQGITTDLRGYFTTNIPIREMVQFVLPFLNDHRYCSEKHIADREYENDSPDGTYKKGERYPAYAYSDVAIHYYNHTEKTHMVYLRMRGERIGQHITPKFFNQFVRPKLDLLKPKKEA